MVHIDVHLNHNANAPVAVYSRILRKAVRVPIGPTDVVN